MVYDVHVIHEGYSRLVDGSMYANCTCTLLKGQYNIIIDTMTPWDKGIIIDGLKKHNVNCDDIDYVVCTHGHSDHIGNNNLFLKAKQHIVGFSVNHKDNYYLHPFETGEAYIIDDDVSVIPTPGHTSDDVTVVVKSKLYGTVAVAGDLFEKKEDLEDSTLWRDVGGSLFPDKQEVNRNNVLRLANHIIPGHGPMFKVPLEIKNKIS